MTSGRRTYGQWWDWHGEYATVPLADLREVGHAAFERGGATPEDAAFLFDNLLDKTMQGDHARGLVYFPGLIRDALAGRTDLRPRTRVVRDFGATAVVDGGDGVASSPNDLVSRDAMRLAVEKARSYGVGLVGARASVRSLTPIVTTAVDAACIGIVITQSAPHVAPVGGFRPMLGNGPTAIGIPAGRRAPVILDMSFTQTSSSPVLLAAQQGQQVPPGMILDADGQPTTDAADFFGGDLQDTTGHVDARGTLVPLGGHKGYAMIFVIALLVQVLTESSPPWRLGAGGPDAAGEVWGSLHVAIDPTHLSGRDVGATVDAFVEAVTAAPRRDGVDEILYPGQRSHELKQRCRDAGVVAVPIAHIESICRLADELGLRAPSSLRP